MRHPIAKDSVIAIVLAGIALIFLLCFSTTTSPLWGLNDSQDSYVFYIIGKYWAKGHLPYVELWDQKGPIIYLINLCGYLLTHSLTGVFLIQWITLTATLILMFKFYRLNMSTWQALLANGATLFCLFSIYECGNMTEEYLLPWLAGCWYLQYKWVDRFVGVPDTPHPPAAAFLYGLTLAFCLLTRLTNALGVCGGVAFIAINLLRQNNYMNLLSNAGAFVIGFGILFIPTALYFHAHGAFGEMWYGTFSYNVSYASHSGHGVGGDTIHTFFRTYIDGYMCLLTGVFIMLFYKQRSAVGLWMTAIAILVLFWLVNSCGYGHYGMICIPYSCIVFMEAFKLYRQNQHRVLQATMTVLLLVYAAMIITKDITTVQVLGNLKEKERAGKECVEAVMNRVPKEDYNRVAAFDETPYAFIKYDIKPCYRYFTVQTFTMSKSEEHRQRVLSQFETLKAKWILMDNRQTAQYIGPLLKEHYDKVDACGYHELYRLKRSHNK